MNSPSSLDWISDRSFVSNSMLSGFSLISAIFARLSFKVLLMPAIENSVVSLIFDTERVSTSSAVCPSFSFAVSASLCTSWALSIFFRFSLRISWRQSSYFTICSLNKLTCLSRFSRAAASAAAFARIISCEFNFCEILSIKLSIVVPPDVFLSTCVLARPAAQSIALLFPATHCSSLLRSTLHCSSPQCAIRKTFGFPHRGLRPIKMQADKSDCKQSICLLVFWHCSCLPVHYTTIRWFCTFFLIAGFCACCIFFYVLCPASLW